jgi:hypothetical protein
LGGGGGSALGGGATVAAALGLAGAASFLGSSSQAKSSDVKSNTEPYLDAGFSNIARSIEQSP